MRGDEVPCYYPDESKHECCEDALFMVAGDILRGCADYKRYDEIVNNSEDLS